MKKRGIFLIAGAVVLVIILIISGIYLFKGVSQYKDEEGKLGSKITALKKHYAKDPFPSQENVDRENDNVKILNEWYDKLIEALTMNQVEPDTEERSPSKFKDSLSIKVGKLIKIARPENNNGMKVRIPDEFAFGFEQYSGTFSPAYADVPRLTQQLELTEIIAEKLIRSGIEEFISIEREEFETAPAGAEASSAKQDEGKQRRKSTRDDDEKNVKAKDKIDSKQAGLMKEGEYFAKFHFEYEFLAKEKALVDALNQLATLDMFVVITKIDLSKKSSDMIMPVRATMASGTVDAVPVAESGVEVAVAAPVKHNEAPSRPDRQVSGPDMEVPMTVTMGIDVYRFRTDKLEDKGSIKK